MVIFPFHVIEIQYSNIKEVSQLNESYGNTFPIEKTDN